MCDIKYSWRSQDEAAEKPAEHTECAARSIIEFYIIPVIYRVHSRVLYIKIGGLPSCAHIVMKKVRRYSSELEHSNSYTGTADLIFEKQLF